MNSSRTENVARNMFIATGCQIFSLILSFISRTLFINILGADYLGVNGLFSNILTILSFAELGIGTAIIFSMYAPLAENNIEKIKALMALYKKSYRVIGSAIAIIGILIIPLLNSIIKEPPKIHENIFLLYTLFLFNTVVSYFFVYKKSIIVADQKSYITTLYQEIVHSIQIILQLLFLIITHNFIIYLCIQIVCTFITNFCISRKADKMYPYLKDKDIIPLEKKETTSIINNIKALFLYKLGSVVLNGTDNIIISKMLGVTLVGLSSNYILVISSFSTILNQIMGAFTASVGNLNARETKQKRENIFNMLYFICFWVYGFCAAGLMCFLNQFISLWIGNDYVLDFTVVLAIIFNFYVVNVHFAIYTYRTTMGFFIYGKYAPVLAAIINIVLSIVLCKYIGLMGIFIATPIARIITNGIIDPVLVYRKGFFKKATSYFIKYIFYMIVVISGYLLSKFVTELISPSGWTIFFIKVIVFSLIYNIFIICIFSRTKLLKDFLRLLKGLINKTLNKLDKYIP